MVKNVEMPATEVRLERYYFEKYVLEVCIATLERGGVTSKLDTQQFLHETDAWGIPRYPDRTVILPSYANLPREVAAFIDANETYLREPECWLGTWIEPDTGNCYLDITAIYTCLEEARREALALNQRGQRKIVALYDFRQGLAIYLA